jgi:hypothetical protein
MLLDGYVRRYYHVAIAIQIFYPAIVQPHESYVYVAKLPHASFNPSFVCIFPPSSICLDLAGQVSFLDSIQINLWFGV